MSRRPPRSRPAIWAEGRQSPPFDPRAFGRATLILAREGMAGVLERCAMSALAFGAEVRAGRWKVPAERLGRSGRLLPPHGAVGRGVLIGAEVLEAASETVLPLADRMTAEEEDPQPLVTIHRAHRDGAAPAPLPSAEMADLAEIRAILAGPRPAASPAAPAPETPAAPAPAPVSAPVSAPAQVRAGAATAQPPAVPAGDADLAAVQALMSEFDLDPEPAPPPRPAPAPLPPSRSAAFADLEAATDEEAAPGPAAADPADPAADPATLALPRRAAPRWVVWPMGRVLGWGLLAMALPYGAARAGIAHLRGEDLRKLV